jgi:hypothetical protein
MDALEVFPVGAPARIGLNAHRESFPRLQHNFVLPRFTAPAVAQRCDWIIC